MDFYPNNGTDHPGCDQGIRNDINDNGGIYPGGRDFVACNHVRSVKFFQETVSGKECFSGYTSETYMDFQSGYTFDSWTDKHGNKIYPKMGYHSEDYKQYMPKENKNVVFLKTTAEQRSGKGFCGYSLLVLITFDEDRDIVDTDTAGDIVMVVHSKGVDSAEIVVNPRGPIRAAPGVTNRFHTQSVVNIGDISYVSLKFKASGLINRQYLTIREVEVFEPENDKTFKFRLMADKMKIGNFYEFVSG